MIIENIQRRLDRLDFIMLTAEQFSVETGKPVDIRLVRIAAKKALKWNAKRVSMNLPEYW
jgi:hypothetical protein